MGIPTLRLGTASGPDRTRVRSSPCAWATAGPRARLAAGEMTRRPRWASSSGEPGANSPRRSCRVRAAPPTSRGRMALGVTVTLTTGRKGERGRTTARSTAPAVMPRARPRAKKPTSDGLTCLPFWARRGVCGRAASVAALRTCVNRGIARGDRAPCAAAPACAAAARAGRGRCRSEAKPRCGGRSPVQ